MLTLTDIDSRRFWAAVHVADNDCWEWTGSLNPHGYGAFNVNDGHRQAHRVAYEIIVGPIPDGLQIDHLCRNPPCVNPAHLEAVTQRENILRGVGFAAKAARATHCPSGHPYNEANTYVSPSTGWRRCRTCMNRKAPPRCDFDCPNCRELAE